MGTKLVQLYQKEFSPGDNGSELFSQDMQTI